MAKILLVEDNEMNRDMLSRRLERQGLRGGDRRATAGPGWPWRAARRPT